MSGENMPEAVGAAARPGTDGAQSAEGIKEATGAARGAPASSGAKPAAGLRSIILIHSYLSSRPGAGSQIAAVFRVGEHTQVNGANGSGKTSLLRLIPVFYGMDPGRAVTRSSVKRSFTSYYLPTDRSYIIFEYVTGLGRPALAVLTRSGQNTVNYRFISSSFSAVKDVFIERSTDPESGTESWQGASRERYTRALSERKITFTRLLGSIDEYRSVIGNLPGRNSPGADFLNYSLCANGNRLMHIEKIAQSLITGRVSLENMKLLIADILNSQSSEVSLQVNRAALREVTSDCRGIKAFLGKEKEFRSYAENALRLASVRKSLLTLRTGINNALAAAQERSAALRTEMDENDRNLQERISALEERRNQAQNALATKDLERKDAERECAQIEARREEFDQENIEEKRQAVMSIPSLQEELREDRKSFERIANDFDAVGSLIDGRKAQKESAYQKEAARISAERHEASEKAAARKSSILAEKSDAERSLERGFYDERLALGQKKAELEGEIRKNESLLRNTVLLAAPELVRRREEAEKALGAFRDGAGSLGKELLGMEEKIRAEEELIRQKESGIDALRERESALTAERDRLQSLEDQGGSTLLSFLRNSVPGWEETVGKTLREDLLLRTDLRPELIPVRNMPARDAGNAEGDSGTLREALPGILLDTSKIAAPSIPSDDTGARKAELDPEIAGIVERIAELAAEKRSSEESLSALRQRRSDLAERISDTGREDALRQALSDAEDALRESARKKAGEIESLIKELRGELNGLGKATEEAEKRHNEELTALRQSFLERTAAVDAEASEGDSAAEERLRNLRESHRKEMDELESEKKELLGKKGIDDGTVRLWHERIAGGEKKIAEAEGFRDLVAEYQNWKRDSWSRLDSLRANLQKITLGIKDLEKSLSRSRAELREARDERAKAQKDLTAQLRDSDAMVQRLELIRNGFDSRAAELPAAPLPEGTAPSDAAGLADEAEKALREYERLKEGLAADADSVRTFISGSSCPWEELRRGIVSLTGRKEQSDGMKALFPGFDMSGAGETPEQAELLKPLAAMYRNTAFLLVIRDEYDIYVPQNIAGLVSNARNQGQIIDNFYEKLRKFHESIASISRQIGDAIRERIRFSEISLFEVKLESRIESLRCAESLRKVTRLFREWLMKGGTELPGEEFVSSLESFLGSIKDLDTSTESLFDIVFTVNENGHLKTARTSGELEGLSSNGITFLIICVLYISLIHIERQGQNIMIAWPVDEIARLSSENTHRLMGLLSDNNIAMISAAPEFNTSLLGEFPNIYYIGTAGVLTNTAPEDSLEKIMRSLGA